MEGNI